MRFACVGTFQDEDRRVVGLVKIALPDNTGKIELVHLCRFIVQVRLRLIMLRLFDFFFES